MIITKTPFRISFCGGGSDMADFYRQNGGCVLSTTINRYMYLTIHPYFDESKTALRYSEIEIVDDINQIDHSIFHQILKDMRINGVEISSTADVPSGTGLGSSSSFTVGLLHTLCCYQGKFVSKGWLAHEACQVEIEKLGNPIGKQDQYAAAYGGLNFIEFHRDDSVTVSPIIMQSETKEALEENLMMFYTGITHDANMILAEQRRNISKEDKTQNLIEMCRLARCMKEALEGNELSDFLYAENNYVFVWANEKYADSPYNLHSYWLEISYYPENISADNKYNLSLNLNFNIESYRLVDDK